MFRFLTTKLQTASGALAFLLFLSVVTVGFFFVISPTASKKNKQEPGQQSGIVVEWESIDKKILDQVNTLRQESLQESLAKLSFPGMYFWPGTFVEGEQWHPIRFPLVPAIGQYDIDTIMSNRRVLKIYCNLFDLSRGETLKLLKEHMGESAKWHKKHLDRYVEVLLPHAKKGQYVAIPRQLVDSGEPTMHGMRLKLLSVVLIAGNLELKELFGDIASVVNESCRQYEVVRTQINGSTGFEMACWHSLYNRQILATGLLKTAPDNPDSKALRQKFLGQWKTKKLPHYDAKFTPYDIFSSRGFVGTDYSQGKIIKSCPRSQHG